MKLLKNKMLQSFSIQLWSLLLIEIIFRLINGYPVFNYSLLRVFLFSAILATIISYLTSSLKPKKMIIINLILVFIYSFYSFIQIGYLNYMGSYMSTAVSSQLGAVSSYIPEFIKSLKPIFYCEFIPFTILLILIVIISKFNNKKTSLFHLKKHYTHENTIMLITAMIGVLSSGMLYYNFLDDRYMQDEQAISLRKLFASGSQPGLYIKEFGIMPYSIIDLKNKIVPSEVTLDTAQDTFIAVNETRKFDDSSWLEVIANENDSILNSLNNYFISQPISSTNDKTGFFKDKNLIVIMMESVNDIIDNPEYYPNFAYLKNNGWYFANHFSPRSNCPTSNNEFSSLTGLYADSNICTANIYEDNTYYESLFNLFNNAGYYANSFHNYYNKYYDREIYHPNLGSDKYHNASDMGLEISDFDYDWTSDVDMMEYYLQTLDSEVPRGSNFMSFIITVTSHGSYEYPSLYGDMYLDMTENTDYSMPIRRYLSKLKVVDNALGTLIDGLKAKDLLDDTIIVLYGDHYPYNLGDDLLKEVLTRDIDNYERERTPLIIYNPGLEKQEFTEYTSYLNLTPTIANLFALDFDPRLYVGEDYFSDEFAGIVTFPDLSWLNKDLYYESTTGEVTYFSDKTYTSEEIKQINQKIYNKNNASILAVRYNYFAYLEDALKKYEKEVES